jgi:hypothetical protein
MKTQLNAWKFRTAVCLVALMLASGCANKTNVSENEQVDGFAENGEQAPADGQTAEQGGTEVATGDANATEAELFGEKTEPAADPAANTAATDPGAAPATDPAMDSLFAPNQDPNASADPNFAELTGQAPGTEAPATDPAATQTSGSTDPSVSADPLLAGSSTSSNSALTDPTTPTFTEPKKHVVATAPKIPGRAMTRKGVSLNRYYFLRQGDTAKSVSELLYGDASHAKALKKWNKGNWMAGKVIYYASATQADDAQMISFYDERSLTPEEHKVGKGETMSTIAKKMLGSRSSWKELAVVNGLTRPDGLKRGQTIKVFKNLGGNSAPTQLAETIPEQVAPPGQGAVTAVPDIAQAVPPVSGIAPSVDPSMDPADDLNKAKKKTAKQSVSLGKLISQNSFALVTGLGIGLLLISLMMINKRKRSGGGGGADEFSEDAFAAPEKKKRR